MVSRVDISYKYSLKGSDRFLVKIALKREGIKLLFFEDIYKIPDYQLCAKGCVEIICLQNGKLTRGDLFDTLFSKELKESEN